MSGAPKQDWTKPAAMAIPKGGFSKDGAEQGRYGPIFPKTPACYGFSIVAKIKPGTEQNFREHGKTLEKAVAETPDCLAVLKLHYLRWLLFDIKGETYFMYQGFFDTDFDKYTEDAVAIFSATGLTTVFENLEDFPTDWKTNAPAFIKFVREHHCPSFLEYGEYPYVSADEIKKALKLKAAFSDMLDQMQWRNVQGQSHGDLTTKGFPEMNTNDPLTAVQHYIDAFNKGDAQAMAAVFAVPGFILDGMAPHVWHGPTAAEDWYRDVLVEGEQHGASRYYVTLSGPLHNNITGESAYIVVPAAMTFQVRGRQVTQTGAVFTVALRKLGEEWRIAAWAWAKGTR